MSNFKCEKCGTVCYDTPNGYITGCEHYPADLKYLDIIKCFVCGNSFAARFPKTGDSATCSHCGAEGHGTYDEGGNYMLEWYESDTWS